MSGQLTRTFKAPEKVSGAFSLRPTGLLIA